MTFWDFLNGDNGHTFLLALITLMNAMSYFLWWLSHRDRQQLHQELNGHLQQHVEQALAQRESDPPTKPS